MDWRGLEFLGFGVVTAVGVAVTVPRQYVAGPIVVIAVITVLAMLFQAAQRTR